MVKNVNKQIAVDTLLLLDRAKVEQFSTRRTLIVDLLPSKRNVLIGDHDLILLQIKWRSQQLNCLKQRQLVRYLCLDLNERIEQVRCCFRNLLEIVPINGVADLYWDEG